MDLLLKSHYISYPFSKNHTSAIIFSLIFSLIVILLPIFMKKKNRSEYMVVIGYLFLTIKLFDIIYRIYIERYPLYSNLPLNICNVLLIFGALYLITKKNIFYNISYFWIFMPIITIIHPGRFDYSTHLYMFSFIITHFLPVVSFILGKLYMKNKINVKGLRVSMATFVILFLTNMFIINPKLDTNFFFTQEYIIDAVNFLELNVYRIIFVLLILIGMLFMYFIKRIID